MFPRMITSARPWEHWIPGALNKRQVKELYAHGLIFVKGADELDIGASSIDLTLSDEGFLMDGSVKPSREAPYEGEFAREKRVKLKDDSFLLERKNTYVFRLRERLNAEMLGKIGIHGQATAKSSVGRLDVLARLIVDGMDRYEGFSAKGLQRSSGIMYLEITPITFDIRVNPGKSLSQLRMFYGDPEDSMISGTEVCKTVLGNDAEEHILTLNLEPDRGACAYCAEGSKIPISLSAPDGSLDPTNYWKLIPENSQKRIQIESGKFYILRSKQRLWVPDEVAIYCRASDETIGEMRIHYAGFVHPGFGQDGPDGAPLIFEVRGHQVKANLMHGEKMANLIFYRMSKPDRETTPYDKQELKLSKIFAEWPTA